MQAPLDDLAGKRAVLIAGPTGGGKSAAALQLAEAAARKGRAAWIVNADSMQVYDALRVLTARPSDADMARAPHRLFGHVPAEERYSTGAWLSDLEAVLREAELAGALPVIVGGTGLYFKALTEGLVRTPKIPSATRRLWMERLAGEGPAALHAQLAERDPRAAERIRANDASRILRALEVIDATGRPLAEWQDQSSPPLLPAKATLRLIVEPARDELYRRIDERFDTMVTAGALDEVRALLKRNVAAGLPVMKAIGVREFAEFLAGEISLEEAVQLAKMETRRYAKRQLTWFRHQSDGWERVAPSQCWSAARL